MRRTRWVSLGMLAVVGLSACAMPGSKNTTAAAIRQEMDAAAQERVKAARIDAVNNALLPPLALIMPKVDTRPVEAKFDLSVNNTPASQVFTAIASGTRYNMLVPAEVTGNISLNLKDVTVFEALEAIRELYGYDYKVDATRIYIQPIALQTRLFQVNYLTATRAGASSLSVQSSSGGSGSTSGTGGTSGASSGGGAGSSNVTTTTNPKANFWAELEASLKALVGNANGRSVVINSMSGVIVVRAMPDELKSVTAYLKASQISIERQVILEAKIVEVQLNDSFQSGVNWAGFGSGGGKYNRGSVGAPNGTLLPLSPVYVPNANAGLLDAAGKLVPLGVPVLNPAGAGVAQNITNGVLSAIPGTSLTGNGSLFGLAFQTANFAAMLDFLETQGNVHVLSSPRIATLNNQKAILKVGTDEYFVTGFTAGTPGTANTPGTPPTTTYTPMFSGIALDVTPSINEHNEIILHVHPSVSQITSQNIALAGGGTVPMALTSISETDSVVRARDGQIVVIGGLMRQATFDDQSGLPGLSKTLFGQTSKRTEKRELILLLKPTVVDSDKDWSDDIGRSRDRIGSLSNVSGAKP